MEGLGGYAIQAKADIMTLQQFIIYLQGLLDRCEVHENPKLFFIDIHKPGDSVQDLSATVDENGLSIFNTS
jgi:hypothetical protein